MPMLPSLGGAFRHSNEYDTFWFLSEDTPPDAAKIQNARKLACSVSVATTSKLLFF